MSGRVRPLVSSDDLQQQQTSAAPLVLSNGLVLSPDEGLFYQRLWALANPAGLPVLDGHTGAEFFSRSGLPNDLLYRIWSVADAQDEGVLSFEGFCVACRLVAHAQTGDMTASPFQPPKSVPILQLSVCGPPSDSTTTSVTSGLSAAYPQTATTAAVGVPPVFSPLFSPSSYPPTADSENIHPSLNAAARHYLSISDDQRNQYLELLSTVGTDLHGYLAGPVAKPLFTKSGLPDSDLAQIWALVDRDGDGKLSPVEFVVAMHLVTLVRQGILKVPTSLPPPLAAYLTAYSPSDEDGTLPAGNNEWQVVNSPHNFDRKKPHRSSVAPGSGTNGVTHAQADDSRSFSELVSEAQRQQKLQQQLQGYGDDAAVKQFEARSRQNCCELEAAQDRMRSAKSNKELIKEAIQADKVFMDELALDVDLLADELVKITEAGIALRNELAAGKDALRKQRERKLDFERQVHVQRRELARLQDERRKVDVERVGLKRDLEHYQDELLFLQSQEAEMMKDLESIREGTFALAKSLAATEMQTQQLNATRSKITSRISSERQSLKEQEFTIAEIRRKLDTLRREKAEHQNKFAILQERLRQADQDRNMHMQSLESDRTILAALQDERVALTEEKVHLTCMLSAIDSDWQKAKHVAIGDVAIGGCNRSAAEGAQMHRKPLLHANSLATGHLPRDSKGVPFKGASRQLKSLQQSQCMLPETAHQPWTDFGASEQQPTHGRRRGLVLRRTTERDDELNNAGAAATSAVSNFPPCHVQSDVAGVDALAHPSTTTPSFGRTNL